MTWQDPPGGARSDPLYDEGMAHLQAGKWTEAIHAFEALAAKYPDDPIAATQLEQARFRARIDAATSVRAKRLTFRWRPLLVRIAIIGVLAVGAFIAWQLLNQRVAPQMAQVRAEQRLSQSLRDGLALLDADKLDEAEAKLNEVLAEAPERKEAQAGLARIAVRRELRQACDAADAAYDDGELTSARAQYQDVALLAGDKGEITPCDVTKRITAINNVLVRDDLFAEAEQYFSDGRYAEAVDLYGQVQQLDNNFERAHIADRLYESYMTLGGAVIKQFPPVPEDAPVALDYFTKSLSVRPRDLDAQTEQRLISLYIAGRQSYDAGRWQDVATQLGSAYDSRPGYMGDTTLNPLYDALIRYGDQLKDRQDYYLAWEQYRRAAALPVPDATLAQGRMAEVQSFLTPTPTPTHTPTATPLPPPTAWVPPTAIPSATPPAPLASYRNQIVFRSDKEDEKGFWVMNPDGSNRRFLGARGLDEQFKQLRERESFSPDGRYRVYTTVDDQRGDKSPQIYYQGRDDSGVVTTRRLTSFAEMSYDPVWSPDGSRIAYVSTVEGSDDIWVLNLDDLTKWNRTKLPNNVKWEWDKHPSWSPDSRKIVFWTNREGTKQIYVMDSEGREQINLSNVEWDEYDPIWVK